MLTEKSIVVLPFENISSDAENEFFADGMTEEIINALSKIDGLKVIARTSSFAYKNNTKDIREIGKELEVSAALEGSVRKSGTRIRISTQLIKTDNGFQVWSESFDRNLSDIFDLQDEISLLIADRIRENFGHLEINEHLVTAQTKSLDAYSSFLKGRFHHLRWNVDDFELAVDAYEESIQLDPNYYQPYFGLVQCYGLMSAWNFSDRDDALEKAGYYLKKGLEINSECSEAYFALTTRSLWIEWKPYKAISYIKKALAINPFDAESLESAAECYIALGQFKEAENCMLKALEANPHSANHLFTIGNIHYLQEDYSTALKWFEKSLQIDPNWDFSLLVSACCYVLLGDKSALDQLLEAHTEIKDGFLFEYLFDAIQNGESIDLSALPELYDVYFPWSLWMRVYADNSEEAIKQLKSGIHQKNGQYLNFQREPLNKPLHALPEYQSLAASVFDEPLTENKTLDATAPKMLIPEDEQEMYRLKLIALMEREELFLSDKLTLRNLAECIGLSPNKLSWLLNEVIGKNFNEYVNGLRLTAFKQRVMEPEANQFSLIGLAYECGFNSKSVFNDFFKKNENMTPSAWVKSQRSSK